MASPSVFRQLGFFVFPDFLDAESRITLCRHVAAAPAERAVIVSASGEQQIDLESRSVDCCMLPKQATASVEQRLLGLRPELERHFGLSLPGFEPPQYLVYSQGDFFKPHTDVGHYHGRNRASTRRVSAVIFLNQQSLEPMEDTFSGGHLTFYGLLEGERWEKCALPLDAEPGLLTAFLSDTWHEVRPVTRGRRLSVVTWFHDVELPAQGKASTSSLRG